jgi:tRNA threonylcarbamoyladenosine biosynthesis protein TsaE
MNVSLGELPKFAEQFVADLPKELGTRAYVVGLSGELGAGKTTFTQAVAHALGATMPVTSPTFVFAQRYEINHPPFTALVHVDAYRLEPGAAHTIGWQEYLSNPQNIILVEWSENMLGDFPQDAPILKFSVTDVGSREIEYSR